MHYEYIAVVVLTVMLLIWSFFWPRPLNFCLAALCISLICGVSVDEFFNASNKGTYTLLSGLIGYGLFIVIGENDINGWKWFRLRFRKHK